MNKSDKSNASNKLTESNKNKDNVKLHDPRKDILLNADPTFDLPAFAIKNVGFFIV